MWSFFKKVATTIFSFFGEQETADAAPLAVNFVAFGVTTIVLGFLVSLVYSMMAWLVSGPLLFGSTVLTIGLFSLAYYAWTTQGKQAKSAAA